MAFDEILAEAKTTHVVAGTQGACKIRLMQKQEGHLTWSQDIREVGLQILMVSDCFRKLVS